MVRTLASVVALYQERKMFPKQQQPHRREYPPLRRRVEDVAVSSSPCPPATAITTTSYDTSTSTTIPNHDTVSSLPEAPGAAAASPSSPHSGLNHHHHDHYKTSTPVTATKDIAGGSKVSSTITAPDKFPTTSITTTSSRRRATRTSKSTAPVRRVQEAPTGEGIGAGEKSFADSNNITASCSSSSCSRLHTNPNHDDVSKCVTARTTILVNSSTSSHHTQNNISTGDDPSSSFMAAAVGDEDTTTSTNKMIMERSHDDSGIKKQPSLFLNDTTVMNRPPTRSSEDYGDMFDNNSISTTTIKTTSNQKKVVIKSSALQNDIDTSSCSSSSSPRPLRVAAGATADINGSEEAALPSTLVSNNPSTVVCKIENDDISTKSPTFFFGSSSSSLMTNTTASTYISSSCSDCTTSTDHTAHISPTSTNQNQRTRGTQLSIPLKKRKHNVFLVAIKQEEDDEQLSSKRPIYIPTTLDDYKPDDTETHSQASTTARFDEKDVIMTTSSPPTHSFINQDTTTTINKTNSSSQLYHEEQHQPTTARTNNYKINDMNMNCNDDQKLSLVTVSIPSNLDHHPDPLVNTTLLATNAEMNQPTNLQIRTYNRPLKRSKVTSQQCSRNFEKETSPNDSGDDDDCDIPAINSDSKDEGKTTNKKYESVKSLRRRTKPSNNTDQQKKTNNIQVGARVKVYRPCKNQYCTAHVTKIKDDATRCHRPHYLQYDNGDCEWRNLQDEKDIVLLPNDTTTFDTTTTVNGHRRDNTLSSRNNTKVKSKNKMHTNGHLYHVGIATPPQAGQKVQKNRVINSTTCKIKQHEIKTPISKISILKKNTPVTSKKNTPVSKKNTKLKSKENKMRHTNGHLNHVGIATPPKEVQKVQKQRGVINSSTRSKIKPHKIKTSMSNISILKKKDKKKKMNPPKQIISDELSIGSKVSFLLNKIDIGSRLMVWWPLEKKYYPCTLIRINDCKSRPHFLKYDDGDYEWTNLVDDSFYSLNEVVDYVSDVHSSDFEESDSDFSVITSDY